MVHYAHPCTADDERIEPGTGVLDAHKPQWVVRNRFLGPVEHRLVAHDVLILDEVVRRYAGFPRDEAVALPAKPVEVDAVVVHVALRGTVVALHEQARQSFGVGIGVFHQLRLQKVLERVEVADVVALLLDEHALDAAVPEGSVQVGVVALARHGERNGVW